LFFVSPLFDFHGLVVTYIDAFGEKKELAHLDDALILDAVETCELVEQEHEFDDTLMTTSEFTKSSTWAYPMQVGSEIIGVLKTEGMLMAAQETRQQLQAFFNYAALALKNEILGYTQLQKAYDQLSAVNEELTQEVIERKRIETALRESEEQYRALFANMACGFAYHSIELDDDGNPCDYIFLETNDTFERFTGLKGEDIINQKVADIIPGVREAEPDLISAYGKVALTGEPIKFELFFEPFDKWYLVTSYSPQQEYFAVLFDDITERKQAEAELQEAKDLLEEKVKERTAELVSANEQLQIELAERKRAEEEIQVRARQQETVALLGQRALEGVDITTLMNEAITLITQTLMIEYAKVLELLPDGSALLLLAGVGWLVKPPSVSNHNHRQAIRSNQILPSSSKICVQKHASADRRCYTTMALSVA